LDHPPALAPAIDECIHVPHQIGRQEPPDRPRPVRQPELDPTRSLRAVGRLVRHDVRHAVVLRRPRGALLEARRHGHLEHLLLAQSADVRGRAAPSSGRRPPVEPPPAPRAPPRVRRARRRVRLPLEEILLLPPVLRQAQVHLGRARARRGEVVEDAEDGVALGLEGLDLGRQAEVAYDLRPFLRGVEVPVSP
ncbi:hypothetical protein THAOC_14900, partial [Thalassiosira oceanica]